ncbi:hypothetical protein [Ochrobactrum soli]|uniref:Uncharacterized protein n=1 Tax=Ochrobactrum soli TaxID=2448455 RepID=A0A2P9HEV0_9HYPH|nr:hypothetical protein [[Ochrobactrum] soli]SPL62605.1 hypothetical protein OHAE_5212 [[Ochrobactrum] soli]
MKNPVRNVVVEYKNRRPRKPNASLWGNLDLKSIAREIEEDAQQSHVQAYSSLLISVATENQVGIEATNDLPPAVAVPENTADTPVIPESPVNAVREPEEAAIVTLPLPESGKEPKAKVTPKKPSGQRAGTRIARLKQRGATPPVIAEMDTPGELALLETENAALKRELIAKLKAENKLLLTMLGKAEQRSTR